MRYINRHYLSIYLSIYSLQPAGCNSAFLQVQWCTDMIIRRVQRYSNCKYPLVCKRMKYGTQLENLFSTNLTRFTWDVLLLPARLSSVLVSQILKPVKPSHIPVFARKFFHQLFTIVFFEEMEILNQNWIFFHQCHVYQQNYNITCAMHHFQQVWEYVYRTHFDKYTNMTGGHHKMA